MQILRAMITGEKTKRLIDAAFIVSGTLLLVVALLIAGCAPNVVTSDLTVPGYDYEKSIQGFPTPSEINEQTFTQPDGTEITKYLNPLPVKKEHPLIRCTNNVLYKHAWMMTVIVKPNRDPIYVEIDTNQDGKKDVVFIYNKDNDELKYPDEYVVDLDFDGEPDALYKDEGHTGKCDNIKLWVPPLKKPENPNTRSEANV